MYLITGAGGGVGSVSRRVVELLRRHDEPVRAMVRRDDDRADWLRMCGAQVVVGDLTRPQDVAAAVAGARQIFFNMSVSLDYLQATAVMCAVLREQDAPDVVVNMSQMTVSQMTATSTEESRQQRLHWLSEQIMNWSGLPVVHVRPTVFLDNPMFTFLAQRSVRERGVLPLPFGTGRTSPIAATDVARVVEAVLREPAGRIGHAYDLTGPEVLDIDGLAARYSLALGRPVVADDLPHEAWVQQVLRHSGLPDHVQQHLATMARLHREGRYDRATTDVEQLTGEPAQTVESYIAGHPALFS